MHVITKDQFDVITNINPVWNQFEKTIPFVDRQLGAFHIENKRILPKFFFKYNNIGAYQVNNDIAFSQIDQVKKFKKESKFEVEFDPRPEQQIVFDTVLGEYKTNGNVNGIIQAKPGVGKTFMSIKLASMLKYKTLCIVPNSILEDQWIDEICNFTGLSKEDVGVLQGSDIKDIQKKGILDKDIIVVKIQTLLSQLKRIDITELIDLYSSIGLVFYDECHQSGAAESYSKTSSIFTTDNIIGLSATPFLKGINQWLMLNSIGEILVDLDHQNLIPTVNIHSIYTEFTDSDVNRLRYSQGDYIKFLATHNMLLEQKDAYMVHLADYVEYRRKQGHIVAILFATNKLVYKMHQLLINKGLDVGVITGSTKKTTKKVRQYVTIQNVHDFYNNYFKVFPRRKQCPEFKIFKDDANKFTFNKKIEKDIEKINLVLDEPIIIQETIEEELSEREIMGKRDIIVSNFKMLTTGYSRSELSTVIIGTPLVGAIPTIQVTGRATRSDPNKNQDVQAHFFFTDYYFKMFPDMKYTLLNNLKKAYPTAQYIFEGFDDV